MFDDEILIILMYSMQYEMLHWFLVGLNTPQPGSSPLPVTRPTRNSIQINVFKPTKNQRNT